MTPAEHYIEAERLLGVYDSSIDLVEKSIRQNNVQQTHLLLVGQGVAVNAALAHATLATAPGEAAS